MSNKIQKNKDILQVLSNCKLNIRKAILQKADRELVDAICECVFNILEGNINLTEAQKKDLYKYRHILRKLVDKSNLKNKKKLLVQHGGFLQYLIPAAIGGISQIISSIINKE
jgi:hypothetical protein